MRRGRHVAFTISVAILFGVRAVSASEKDLACNDLQKTKPARLISTLQGYEHGTGYYSEDEDDPKERDWKVTVDKSRRVGDDRLLLVVSREHLTGSGAWLNVLVFGCRSGKVSPVFNDTFLYGVDFEEVSAEKLVLKVGKWTRTDPDCCPSMEERKVYLWDKDNQKYVLDRDDSFPIAKP